MVFPASPLDVKIELAIGADHTADPSTWSFTDVTADTREKPKVTITAGRRSRIGQVAATTISAVCDNTGGNLSRHNPLGTHYGSLKKHTPMRVSVNNGGGYKVRATGYVPGFPPGWDPSERDQWVTLKAAGIMQRLGRSKNLRSALYRTMAGVAPGDYVPLSYIPMEDGSGATQFASGVAGAAPAIPGGGYSPASASACAGSLPLPTFDLDARVLQPVPAHTSTGQWVHQFIANIPSSPVTSSALLAEYYTPSGAVVHWQVTIDAGGTDSIYIRGYNADGTELVSGSTLVDSGDLGSSTDFYGHTFMFTVSVHDFGATHSIIVDAVREDQLHLARASDTLTDTFGTLQGDINLVSPIDGTVFGHSALYVDDNFDAITDTSDSDVNAAALNGNAGEQAHTRISRLCREEGVRVTVTGSSSAAMGAQSTGNLMTQLRECAATDMGVLAEGLNWDLTYLCLANRYNIASPAITLEYDQRHIAPPWEPNDDDQDYFNDVTASRPGGSSYRAADEDEIDEVGQADTAAAVNTHLDTQLADAAGWLTHLGTNDELTWPSVSPNLAGEAADLLDDWLLTTVGEQMWITGHPSPLAPDTIRQVVEGYTETLGSFVYDVTCILSPASVYDVAEADDDVLGRADTEGMELATAVTSTGTTLIGTTISGPVATVDSGEFPVDLKLYPGGRLTGEVVTATAIAYKASDAFDRNTSNGWGTADIGGTWSRIGGVAGDFSTTTAGSGVGIIAMATLGTERWMTLDVGYADIRAQVILTTNTIPSGAVAIYGLGYRMIDSNNYWLGCAEISTTGAITAQIRKRAAGTLTTVATSVTNLNIADNIVCEIEGQGDWQRLRLWKQTDVKPLGWTVEVESASALNTETIVGCFARREGGSTGPTSCEFDDFAVTSPQTITVDRSVNGVVRSWPAGTLIALASDAVPAY